MIKRSQDQAVLNHSAASLSSDFSPPAPSPHHFCHSNLPSPRESNRIGSSSPMPSGRRGSRVAALEAELKDTRRVSGGGGGGGSGGGNVKARPVNASSANSTMLSAQQQRSLMEEEPRGGKSCGGGGGGSGGGGGGGGGRRAEESKGKPPVSLNREKMSIADLEKRLAGDWTRQNNRRASLAQSLGSKEDPQQQSQQQQQKQKRSKSKGRDSFMGPQGATCFDRRF